LGCSHCLPINHESDEIKKLFAWVGETVHEVLDEPHFIVSIGQCGFCQTHHVHAMAEKIDWATGNDPQQRVRFAITSTEAQKLELANFDHIQSVVEKLASQAGYFESYWPSTGDPILRWESGKLHFMPHD
jgi:hypothetical protein